MSEPLTVKTLWFWRKGEQTPELLVAWDEYSVEENPEGFDTACRTEYERVRAEDSGTGPRHIDLMASRADIERSFLVVNVPVVALVSEPDEPDSDDDDAGQADAAERAFLDGEGPLGGGRYMPEAER